MARSILESIIAAVEGLLHALRTELNLKLFFCGYLLSFAAALWLRFSVMEWIMVVLSGGTFLSIELLNTALERFTDAFDVHVKKQEDVHFEAMKATKDIAAGAALLGAVTWVVTWALLLGQALGR